jgi:hypothetical protein
VLRFLTKVDGFGTCMQHIFLYFCDDKVAVLASCIAKQLAGDHDKLLPTSFLSKPSGNFS